MGVELTDPGMHDRLMRSMISNGVIIDWFLFKPDTFRIAPPLIITNEEIDLACELVIKSLNEV